MSRKHFVSLAKALYEAKPINSPEHDRTQQWERDVLLVARACSEHNQDFDHDKFIRACHG